METNMVNWYYVIGSERVGPVSVSALKVLFSTGEINNDTYIWKKGFANWERLKDVSELKLDEMEIESAPVAAPTPAPAKKLDLVVEDKFELKAPVKKEMTREIKIDQLKKEEKTSPEVHFTFNWHTVKEQEELFFLKIGKDRKHSADDIYGPYSLVELKEALEEKRVNLHTLVFSPGMSSWTKIQDTPVNPDYTGIALSSVSLTEIPLMLVFDSFPQPLTTLVKKAGVRGGLLLGSGPFIEFQNKTVLASLYVGSEMKVKNVQVVVQSYDKKDQAIECLFVDLNTDARKIMLNHAV
jgi:hypothetical protein